MQAGVKHDDREGEYITGIWQQERKPGWVALVLEDRSIHTLTGSLVSSHWRTASSSQLQEEKGDVPSARRKRDRADPLYGGDSIPSG